MANAHAAAGADEFDGVVWSRVEGGEIAAGDGNQAVELASLSSQTTPARQESLGNAIRDFHDGDPSALHELFRQMQLVRWCPIHIHDEKYRAYLDPGVIDPATKPAHIREHGLAPEWSTTLSPSACKCPAFRLESPFSWQPLKTEAIKFICRHNRFGLMISTKVGFDYFVGQLGAYLPFIERLHVELRARNGQYISIHSRSTGTLVRRWKDVCALAATKLRSLRSLSFRARIKDLATAETIAAIFNTSGLQLLASCAARFEFKQRYALGPVPNVVSEMADSAIVNRRLTTPFRFLDLPVELQLWVLKYLVIYRSESTDGNSLTDETRVIQVESCRTFRCAPFTSCCGTCSPVRTACFCDPTTSYSTTCTTTCTCVRSPTRYFLVSRQFGERSRFVFLSGHRFYLVGGPQSYPSLRTYVRHVRRLTINTGHINAFSACAEERLWERWACFWSLFREGLLDNCIEIRLEGQIVSERSRLRMLGLIKKLVPPEMLQRVHLGPFSEKSTTFDRTTPTN